MIDNEDQWAIRTLPDGGEILAYDRPTYAYLGGGPPSKLPNNTKPILAYIGSRWLAMVIKCKLGIWPMKLKFDLIFC